MRAQGARHRAAPTSAAKRSWGASIVRLLPYVGVVVSLLIIAAPALSDRLDAWRARDEISTLSSTVDALSAEDKERLLDQAQRYNAQLSGGAADTANGELLPYEQQLCTDSSETMAWLEIPSIDLDLPIYHGTGESELSAGVGHLEGSSLPVGGASTHCMLTAHSGMAGARMFDDIRLLEPGDVFVLWTLGDPLAYEVTGTETVLPEEVDVPPQIEPGEDLCTLMTCTPYGVNSHRLLVHARRCAYEPEAVAAAPAHVTSRKRPVLLACAAVGAAVLVLVVGRLARRRSGA